MATPAQLEANRANAQHSTGPSSPEGKAKSSHNALKTGLTGHTILLPTDDVAAYKNLVSLIEKKYGAETDEERLLVQSIADTQWRLLRVPLSKQASTPSAATNSLPNALTNRTLPPAPL